MTRTAPSPLLRYCVVPPAVAAAMLLRWPLWPVLGDDLAFLFLWPAMMFCAWYGGLGPGLLATALSAAAAAFFLLEPHSSFAVSRTADLVGLATFVAVGAFVSVLNENLRQGKRAVERHAREVLREREWLRVTLASIGDAVIATDAGGRVAFMNAVAESLAGWKQDEAAGRPLEQVFRIVNEETRMPVDHPVREVLDRGVVVGLANHTILIARGGAEVPIEDSAAPIRDGRGDTLGVVLVFHDVSERRRAEEARSRLAAIVESCEDAIIGKALDGTITSWNSGAERLYGYSADEVCGRPIAILVPPERADELSEVMERIRRGEPIRAFDTVRTGKGGRRLDVSVAVSPIKDAAGRVIGASVIARDLADRKRADAELLRSERHLRAVIETTPECVKLLASDGTLLEMNAAGLAMLEADGPGAVVGRSVYEVVAPEHRDQYRAFHESVCQGGRGSMSYDIVGMRGGRRAVETVAAPLVMPDGTTLHLGVTRDVTERRRLEEQYRQAQKMDAFGQLAGGVAHDFNNLLTIINGYSQLLLQRMPADDPGRALLAEVYRAGERSASLTRQLLVFSRRQVVAPRVLDLNEVVAEAEKMLRRLIGEDVGMKAALCPYALPVLADPGQVEQVLMNLAVNARDAMPKGGRLTIETSEADLDGRYASPHADVRPGHYALLAVSDSGCGMTPEVQGRAFEPFFTTKGVGKGTGLGLAVVHGIVKGAGGHVAVYSEVGVGTTFKVYLPVAAGAGRPAPSESAVRAAPGGTETVLLVEDEERVRGLAATVLLGCGYRVLEAAGGDEALRVAGGHAGPIHLLVTDVVMPGTGGRALAERLVAGRPGTRVLFVSGYTDDAVVRHGVLEEQAHFFQKPFTPLALARKVREVLDAGQAVM